MSEELVSFWQGHAIYLFTKAPSLALVPTQPPSWGYIIEV
jgi:hypothetical protein